jgi:hypothetical protein
MSLDGVIAGLRAACEGMDGIVAVDVGEPSPMPRTADQFPRIIIEVGTTAMTQKTFGKTDGWVELGHQGSIRLLLGTSDSRISAAIKRMAPLVQQLRRAFYTDLTFGGECRDAALTTPQDNLGLYRRGRKNEYPEVRWRWAAMEDTTTGALAE